VDVLAIDVLASVEAAIAVGSSWFGWRDGDTLSRLDSRGLVERGCDDAIRPLVSHSEARLSLVFSR
jgi:hypothetical protein